MNHSSGAAAGSRRHCRSSRRAMRGADRGEPRLPRRIAVAVIAAQPRGDKRLVPGQAQGLEQKQLRDSAVARRDRVVGRLQRRVEGDRACSGSDSLGGQGRGLGRKPEQRRQTVDAALHVEVAAHPRLAGGAEPRRGVPGRGSAPRAPRPGRAGRRAAPERRSRRPRSARRFRAAASRRRPAPGSAPPSARSAGRRGRRPCAILAASTNRSASR